jgi:hypothetical protein
MRLHLPGGTARRVSYPGQAECLPRPFSVEPAGVRVVLVLDPTMAPASACRKDEFQQIVHSSDEVNLPDVLPGFTVSIARFFE